MGNVQPAIDKEEHTHPFGETKFGGKYVVQPLPPAFSSQKKIDYDGRGDDNPVYVGFNTSDAATSDTDWVVQKVTYDGSDRPTLVQVARGSWDNRASLF